MGSRTQPAADRVYEDFEPFYEWDTDEGLLNVMLPGFRRDQLKVQVTTKPTLRVMGERLIFGNRWRRFNIELPVLSDYDTDDVTAKFEGAKLSIKFGKLTKTKETITPSQPKPAQEDTPKAEEAKTNEGEVSDQKTPQKEETKTETTDGTDKAAQEAKTNGSSETKEAENYKAPKSRAVTRSKTRLIDFTLGDSDVGRNKWKKLVKWVMLILLVLALGGLGYYYGKNALTSYPEEQYFQEL